MYMIDVRKIISFEWDKGNINKSYLKHGITPNEAEEVFVSQDLRIRPDEKHSKFEKRFFVIGKTKSKGWLFVSFTVRKAKLRIISARRIHLKERRKYEK